VRKRPQHNTNPHKTRQFVSVESWDKLARHAPWVSGQSMGISPGDPKAVSRLRHSSKYRARGKKVIRPRVQKQVRRHTDK